jgi:hypothetical protein
MPDRKSSVVASHSVSQSEFAPPLALAIAHSGWYRDERGNRWDTNRWSVAMSVPWGTKGRGRFAAREKH